MPVAVADTAGNNDLKTRPGRPTCRPGDCHQTEHCRTGSISPRPVRTILKTAVKSFEMKQLKDKVIARLFTRYPSLLNRWAQKARIVRYSEPPWTLFTGDPAKSRLALITTGGVHLKSEPPYDMKDRQGDPSFREIPADANPADLSITHNYYDNRDAVRDINTVFPLERVRMLEQFGEIGKVNHRHFSFMGHISNHHIDTLISETAPGVAEKLREDGVDIALLTPA